FISTAIDHLIEALSAPSESSNSLNLKEFVVPLSLEVGRIIRGSGRASTFNFKKLKYKRKRPFQGHQVLATSLAAPVRSSAARAALDLTGARQLKTGTSQNQFSLKTSPHQPHRKNKAGRPVGLPASI
ncbi:hypothetical protein, partial [Pseudomonas sp.]|uniref:hypothetical protein n=1 Tax=Pseudomonas sp. TaxID=306 RepID=UPI0031E023DF